MKAIVWTKYGPPDGLQLREVAKPVPKENQVLIRVHAATVSAGDSDLRRMKMPLALRLPLRLFVGLRKPKRVTILGQELAGEIEATGKDVKRFKVGDQVVGWTGIGLGAYAEYKCLSETGVLEIKPSNLTYEEAATLAVGGLEAAYFIRRGKIRRGEKVLVFGAGGSIGTYAVQLAKYFGAEVTAVDSAVKLDMLRSIGADHVVDYKREDFTRRGETYDVIFDVIGKSSFSRSIRVLAPNGRYLMSNPPPLHMIRGRWTSGGNGKKVIPWASRSASETADDFAFLREVIEAGKLKPVIDRCYPFEQTAEAHRYADTGRKKGNIVITVANTMTTPHNNTSNDTLVSVPA
jgi:NADPH:quinone reductase-like Zn-dependent oxidoreductase